MAATRVDAVLNRSNATNADATGLGYSQHFGMSDVKSSDLDTQSRSHANQKSRKARLRVATTHATTLSKDQRAPAKTAGGTDGYIGGVHPPKKQAQASRDDDGAGEHGSHTPGHRPEARGFLLSSKSGADRSSNEGSLQDTSARG